MAWRGARDKLLSEAMTAYITDASKRHSASMSYTNKYNSVKPFSAYTSNLQLPTVNFASWITKIAFIY